MKSSVVGPVLTGLILLALFLDRPGSSAGPPWIALGLGGAFTVAAGLMLTRRELPKDAWLPALLFVALLLERGLTAFFSYDLYRSEVNLGGWIIALALYLVVVTGIHSPVQWRYYAATTIGIVLVFSVWAFFSYTPNGSVATFASLDNFAFLPLTGALVCLGMLDGRADWRWWLAGSLQLLAFLLVGGRTASGALLAGALALYTVYRIRFIPPEARRGSLGGGTLLMALIALAVFFVFVRPQLPSLSHAIGEDDADRLRWRRDILWQSVSLVPQRPLVGSGPGTFALAYQSVHDQDSPAPDSPQNDLVESLVECGLLGAVLWSLVLATTFLLTYNRALEVIDPMLPQDWSSVGALGALVAASTFSLLFSVIALPATLCWMALLLALAARSGSTVEPPPQPGKLSLALGAVLVLLGLGLLSFAWRGGLASSEVDRGVQAAKAQKLEEALSALERAARLTPEWWRAHYEKAQVLAITPKGRGEALDELQKARRCSPRELTVLRALAQAHLDNGNPALAAETYELGVRLAPARLELKRGFLNALLQQGSVEQALPIALELYTAGEDVASGLLLTLAGQNPAAAVTILEQSKLSDSDLRGLLEATVTRAREQGQSPKVAPLYSVWLKKHPEDWGTRLTQAQLLLEGGQEGEALTILDGLKAQTPASDPAYPEVLCAWASLKHRQGQTLEARKILEQHIQDNPQRAPVRQLLARILIESGDSDKALGTIDDGLQADPNDSELLVLKAKILLERGMAESALEYANLVLAAQPDNSEAADIRTRAMKSIAVP